jgi:hypothetical protein
MWLGCSTPCHVLTYFHAVSWHQLSDLVYIIQVAQVFGIVELPCLGLGAEIELPSLLRQVVELTQHQCREHRHRGVRQMHGCCLLMLSGH